MKLRIVSINRSGPIRDPYSPASPSGFSLVLVRKGRLLVIPNPDWETCFTAVRFDHKKCLGNSWLHGTKTLRRELRSGMKFMRFFWERRHSLLNKQNSMLSSLYMRDFSICYNFVRSFNKISLGDPNSTFEVIERSRVAYKSGYLSHLSCPHTALSMLQFKRCLQLILFRRDGWPISDNTFKWLFQDQRWTRFWNAAELGSWFAQALRLYSSNAWLLEIIEKSFETCKDALVWLFLGAHMWYETSPAEKDKSKRSCCIEYQFFPKGKWSEKAEWCITHLAGELCVGDRKWILEQVIRRSPEFGLCGELGRTLLDFFVLAESDSSHMMLEVLYKDISKSRLRYSFETSIGRAAEMFRRNQRVLRLSGPEVNGTDIEAVRSLIGCSRNITEH